MTAGPEDHAGWAGAAALLAVVAGRLADAVPALARITADVERDWPDEQGRLWGERAALVRVALVHELDAVLDLARLARAAVDGGPSHDDPAHRGSGHAGSGHAGSGHAGSGYLGSGYAGPGYAGPGYAGSGYLGPGYTGPGHEGPGHGGSGYGGPVGGTGDRDPAVVPPPGRRTGGPRLGGTDGQRVDDARGVRIAELGEGSAGSGSVAGE